MAKKKRKQNQSDQVASAVASASQRYIDALQEQATALRSGDQRRAQRAAQEANEARREMETLVSSHWEILGATTGGALGATLGAAAGGLGAAALGGGVGAMAGGFLASPRVREAVFGEEDEGEAARPVARATRPEMDERRRRMLAGGRPNPETRKLKNKLLK